MSEERCENCKFWDRSGRTEDDDEGSCRRYPPVFQSAVATELIREDEEDHESDEEKSKYRFDRSDKAIHEAYQGFCWGTPSTLPDDWCGEFRAKDAAPTGPPATPSAFCRVCQHPETYDSLEALLAGEFYPGNYTPTREQCASLIRAAALSAVAWDRLRAEFCPVCGLEKPPTCPPGTPDPPTL